MSDLCRYSVHVKYEGSGTTPPIFAGPFKAASRNSLPDGVVWPVQRATLAALIDIGLSNAEIAAYFSVLPDDVHMLADRYGLIWQLRVASQSDLRMKSAASSMAEAMHELADGLTAAITYAMRRSGQIRQRAGSGPSWENGRATRPCGESVCPFTHWSRADSWRVYGSSFFGVISLQSDAKMRSLRPANPEHWPEP